MPFWGAGIHHGGHPHSNVLSDASDQLAFAQRESTSSAAFQTLNRLVQYTQAHRGLSAGALAGNQELAAKRPAMCQCAKELDALEEHLKALVQQTTCRVWCGLCVRVGCNWSKRCLLSRSSWPTVRVPWTVDCRYLLANEEIMSEFSMALDPDADTYYLIQAALMNMPQLGKT